MKVDEQPRVEVTERTLNRLRDYVARESLAGRQVTVEQVLEQVLVRALDEYERKGSER